MNDFILSRIANGAEGLGYCATGLIALENLGRFDQERVVKVVDTYVEIVIFDQVHTELYKAAAKYKSSHTIQTTE